MHNRTFFWLAANSAEFFFKEKEFMSTSDSIKYHCKCYNQRTTHRIVCIGDAMRNKRKKIAREIKKIKSNDFLNGNLYMGLVKRGMKSDEMASRC